MGDYKKCLAQRPGYEWLPPRCQQLEGHEGPHRTTPTAHNGTGESWEDE